MSEKANETICETCGENLGEVVVEYEHLNQKDSHIHRVVHVKPPEAIKPKGPRKKP